IPGTSWSSHHVGPLWNPPQHNFQVPNSKRRFPPPPSDRSSTPCPASPPRWRRHRAAPSLSFSPGS
ncbi:hypothetical protein ZEAMMB73_Zm00001d010413, partial [Zea mays]